MAQAEKNGEQLNLFRGIHGIANSIMAHKHASERLKLAQQHEQLARDKFTHKQNQDKQAQQNFTTKENNRMTIHKDRMENAQKDRDQKKKIHDENLKVKKDMINQKKQEWKDKKKQWGLRFGYQMSKDNRAQAERERHDKQQEQTAIKNAKTWEAHTNANIDLKDAQTNYTNTKTAMLQGMNKRQTKNVKWPEKVSNPHVQDAINTSNKKANSYNTTDFTNGNPNR